MATVDPNSAQGQLNYVFSILKTYFNAKKTDYTSGGGLPPLSTLLTSIDFSEILRQADNLSHTGGTRVRGALVEAVEQIQAIQREVDMRNMGKQAFYGFAVDEAGYDSSASTDKLTSYSSALKGTFPDQAGST